jgi:hypothetical protein
MARQTTMNTDQGGSVNGMLNGIGDLGNNVVTLTTLQARLAAEDFRDTASRAWPALLATAVLIPLGFASVTVGLFGLAYLIAADLGVPLVRALLEVAVGGIVLSLIMAALATRRLLSSLTSFRRSREELERNIAWLRTVLVHSGR